MNKLTGSKLGPEKEITTERGLHKGAILQTSGSGRTFKGLGVAKRYCRLDSIGDTFMRVMPL